MDYGIWDGRDCACRRCRSGPRPSATRRRSSRRGATPYLFDVVEALDAVGEECRRSVPQVALGWLLTRPTVSSVIIAARDPEQLEQNLAAADIALTPAQLDTLDRARRRTPVYPYWHQAGFAERNPFPAS